MPAPGVFMPARLSTSYGGRNCLQIGAHSANRVIGSIFLRAFQLHAEDFIRVFRVKALMFIR